MSTSAVSFEPASFPTIGYSERLSARPGETIRFFLSGRGEEVAADVVRLRGPVGRWEQAIESTPFQRRTLSVDRQDLVPGSYALCDVEERLPILNEFAIRVRIWPTAIEAATRPQTLLAQGDPTDRSGWSLGLDADGRVLFTVATLGGGITSARSAGRVIEREWHVVAATCSRQGLRLALRPMSPWRGHPRAAAAVEIDRPTPSKAPIVIAATVAATGARHDHYDGKIEAPVLWDRPIAAEELVTESDDLPPPLVSWNLALRPETTEIVDTGPLALSGRCFNAPLRAVTGGSWDAAESDFRRAPDAYGAIHFHSDDLADAGWQPTLELQLPRSTEPGIYALRTSSHGTSYVPFVVTPRDPGRARVALVLPVFSYIAYANIRFEEGTRDVEPGETAHLGRFERFVMDNPELGPSLYDAHVDQSHCLRASRLKPNIELSPEFRYFRTGHPRHFAADLLIVEWLTRLGIPFDVLTDENLHHDADRWVGAYHVLMTGTHPEYTTMQLNTAVGGHLRAGGHLMYLGGNGFWWVTTVSSTEPHVLEVRRGVTAGGPGRCSPGEDIHPDSGERAGTWGERGLNPHGLVGVGFTAHGWKTAAGYERLPRSFEPDVAALFDGVGDGLRVCAAGGMGGAAGDELDAANRSLGTPDSAAVLASSRGLHDLDDYMPWSHCDSYAHARVHENPTQTAVASELVYFRTPWGGTVFSVGSIAWMLAAADNDWSNDAARIITNVLDRMLKSPS